MSDTERVEYAGDHALLVLPDSGLDEPSVHRLYFSGSGEQLAQLCSVVLGFLEEQPEVAALALRVARQNPGGTTRVPSGEPGASPLIDIDTRPTVALSEQKPGGGPFAAVAAAARKQARATVCAVIVLDGPNGKSGMSVKSDNSPRAERVAAMLPQVMRQLADQLERGGGSS